MSLTGAETDKLRPFRFGWYGDNGLGEALIHKILSGRKTATACPTYDPEEGVPGETLRLVDKSGNTHGLVRITAVETRLYKDFDEELANRLGSSLAEMKAIAGFANSRVMGPNEEMRVTYFELVSK